jgi:hypothetical protein
VYRLDRLNGFGTRQRLDAGSLSVVTVTVDRARDLPGLISAEATGRLAHFRGYREWTAREFEVRSEGGPVDVGRRRRGARPPAAADVPLAARRAARAHARGRARRLARGRRAPRGSGAPSRLCSGCSPGGGRAERYRFEFGRCGSRVPRTTRPRRTPRAAGLPARSTGSSTGARHRFP